jgi:hypothetical protein
MSKPNEQGSGTGVSRKASVCPLELDPSPQIWPESFIPKALYKVQPDEGSIKSFKSFIVPSL